MSIVRPSRWVSKRGDVDRRSLDRDRKGRAVSGGCEDATPVRRSDRGALNDGIARTRTAGVWIGDPHDGSVRDLETGDVPRCSLPAPRPAPVKSHEQRRIERIANLRVGEADARDDVGGGTTLRVPSLRKDVYGGCRNPAPMSTSIICSHKSGTTGPFAASSAEHPPDVVTDPTRIDDDETAGQPWRKHDSLRGDRRARRRRARGGDCRGCSGHRVLRAARARRQQESADAARNHGTGDLHLCLLEISLLKIR